MKICRCGVEFKPNSSNQRYCTKRCQEKTNKDGFWERVKSDYKYRCRNLIGSAKYRANKIKVEFNIDTEFLIELWELQQGKCAVSGRDFDLRRPEKYQCVRPNSPSLDRIDSKQGYVKGNVRIVCYQVNTALNQYGEEALISLCKDILMFNSGVVY